MKNTKRTALLLLAGTLVLLLLLSASLSSLQLQAGSPFPGGGPSVPQGQGFMDRGPAGLGLSTWLRGLLALLFLMFMIYVPARLLALVTPGRVLQLLLITAGLLLLARLIPSPALEQPAPTPGESSGPASLPSFAYPVSPLGKPPAGFVQAVLIVLVLGAGWFVFRMAGSGFQTGGIETQVLQQAESAVRAIQGGEDLHNVILRCYGQMAAVLKEQRGIERSAGMTVREFEEWLACEGFPATPVRQLGRLFEQVRYGSQVPAAQEEEIAVKSLNEIIRFCRTGKE